MGTFGKISCPGVGTFEKKIVFHPRGADFTPCPGREVWVPERIEGSIIVFLVSNILSD